MQTKKHWNSFTTNFFMPPEILETLLNDTTGRSMMARLGSKDIREEMLSAPLRCHHVGCAKQFKNMPALKAHLESHL